MTTSDDAGFERVAARELEYAETPPTASRVPARHPEEGHLAGVCAGLARHVGADVRAVRLAFVLLTFAGAGLVLYAVLWAIMPLPTEPSS